MFAVLIKFNFCIGLNNLVVILAFMSIDSYHLCTVSEKNEVTSFCIIEKPLRTIRFWFC